jgi:hypothetical protein
MTGEFGGLRSGVFWCPGLESWVLRFWPVRPCGFGLFLAVVSLGFGPGVFGVGGGFLLCAGFALVAACV